MKIYRKDVAEGKNIYCLMHWEPDMRSFQINDKMVLFIQNPALGECYLNPEWKDLIKGVEIQFLAFMNEEPCSWEIPSVEDIMPRIEELIEAGEIEFTSTGY